MISLLHALWLTLLHVFARRETNQYPEQAPFRPARWRGRIVLTRDPAGRERCVACNLCAGVCPTDCIALTPAVDADGRRYPADFRINFSRCIFCGFCEEACPTRAIQLTPDFELAEYRRGNMVYEKEHLLIAGPGKYHDYDYYQHAGVAIPGKPTGAGDDEEAPSDPRGLVP